MAKKFANRSCYDCGVMNPVNQMVKKTITEHSGTSFGVNNRKNRSVRAYTRQKRIFLCTDCSTKRQNSTINTWLSILVIGAGLYFYFG